MNKLNDPARNQHIAEMGKLIGEMVKKVYLGKNTQALVDKINLYQRQLDLYDLIMGY